MALHERLLEQYHRDPQPERYLNALTFARETGYARKTIARDLEVMRDEWHFPIEYCYRRKGFYYAREVKQFPTFHMTAGDMAAILYGCQALEVYRGTPFAQQMREAFSKLDEVFGGDLVQVDFNTVREQVNFRANFVARFDLEIFEAFQQANCAQLELGFDYLKPQADHPERRRIRPLCLVQIAGGWYCDGYCLTRKAIRRFLLSRATKAAVGKRKFDRAQHEAALAEFQEREGFGAFGNQHPEPIRLHFERHIRRLVQERDWHPTQQFFDLPDGRLEMRLEVEPNLDLQKWICGWLGECEVIEPQGLRERIREIGEKMVGKSESLKV